MFRVPSRILIAALTAISAISTTQAQPNMGAEHLSIDAKTSMNTIHPGSSGYLAIDIIVADDWHTYWPGVSDTGFGISFEIDAPDSIEFKDPIWPTPIRYLQEGDILDHTYEGTVMVVYPFVVKEDAQPAGVSVNIDANYLVCKDLCLPGSGSDTVSFAIVPEDESETKSEAAQSIEKIVSKRPEPFRTTDPAVRLQWIKGAAAMMFRDATRIEFYPDTECTDIRDLIKDGAAEGNRIEIYFSETEDLRLSGRVRVKTPQGEMFYDIDERAP